MVTVDLKTKDPPDMLTRTVTAFFEELLVKEEAFRDFQNLLNARLKSESELLADIKDNQELFSCFVKTQCIHLYEDFVKSLKKRQRGMKDDKTIVKVDGFSHSKTILQNDGQNDGVNEINSIPPPPPPPPPPPAPPNLQAPIFGSFKPRQPRSMNAATKLKHRPYRRVSTECFWSQPHGDSVKMTEDLIGGAEFKGPFCIPVNGKRTSERQQSNNNSINYASSTSTVICLLETKRSTNISIALSRMKSLEEIIQIMDRVEAGDLSLSEDTLTALIKSEPTAEELALIASFTGPGEQLNFPEKVVCEFSKRPALPWMLRSLRYMQKIHSWWGEVESGLKLLEDAFTCLLESKTLVQVMLCYRRLYELNNVTFGDEEGPVQGIALESLYEFDKVLSVTEPRISLHQFLATKWPEAGHLLRNELDPISKALPVDLDALSALLGDLNAALTHVLTLPSNDLPRSFAIKVREFQESWSPRIEAETQKHTQIHQQWLELCKYFMLDDQEMKPLHVFEIFLHIIQALETADINNK